MNNAIKKTIIIGIVAFVLGTYVGLLLLTSWPTRIVITMLTLFVYFVLNYQSKLITTLQLQVQSCLQNDLYLSEATQNLSTAVQKQSEVLRNSIPLNNIHYKKVD